MEEYLIKWCEVKTPDWKVCTLVVNGSDVTDVSINRTSQKGDVFPEFDEIQAGRVVKGTFWKSPTGKAYLFAPKEKKGGMNMSGVKAAQERKSEMITKFADRKEESIALAGAQRDAVLIVTSLYGELENLPHEDKAEVIKREILYWHNWLLNVPNKKDSFSSPIDPLK